MNIAVQELLLLDEIDEHEAVQHKRGVPLAVGHGGNALNESQKTLVLFLEAFVETLGDALHVKSLLHLAGDINNGQLLFFFEADSQILDLLDQRVSRLGTDIGVLTAGSGAVFLAPDPLPFLHCLVRVNEYDNVLVGAFGRLPFYLAPC